MRTGIFATRAALGLDFGLMAVAMSSLNAHRHHGVGQNQSESAVALDPRHTVCPEVSIAGWSIRAGMI